MHGQLLGGVGSAGAFFVINLDLIGGNPDDFAVATDGDGIAKCLMDLQFLPHTSVKGGNDHIRIDDRQLVATVGNHDEPFFEHRASSDVLSIAS